jgi:hypothetical protein
MQSLFKQHKYRSYQEMHIHTQDEKSRDGYYISIHNKIILYNIYLKPYSTNAILVKAT